jgi:hypothetical protein
MVVEPTVAREQLRVAVVLNGGVSLAVWMGGAVAELDRLTRGCGVYEQLLDWALANARVDVISGTSAGGINGAALAVSQCNDAPGARDLRILRDVWLDSGAIDSLLRQPFAGSPPSLLKGDEFFLPQITAALRQLAEPYESRPVDERPLDLTITATLLRGVPAVRFDRLGQPVTQIRHDGLLRFRRGPTAPGRDDFATDRVAPPGGGPGVIEALALAARTTASYPVAFEPSFLPGTPEPGNGDGAGSAGSAGSSSASGSLAAPASVASMSPYLSGAWDDSQQRIKRSRYAVDGGVLANTPTLPALDAVDAMPAEGLVRRVLLLVHPHAPGVAPDAADLRDKPPTLVGGGAALFKAMTSQGSRNFVDRIARHNQEAGERSALRDDAAGRALLGGPVPTGFADRLAADAATATRPYRLMRARRIAHDLADIWSGRSVPPRALEPQSDDEVLEVATAVVEEALDANEGVRLLPTGGDGLLSIDDVGFEGALHIADVAADYLRRALRALEGLPENDLVSVQVRAARGTVADLRNELMAERRSFRDQLEADAEDQPPAAEASWVSDALKSYADKGPEIAAQLLDIAATVAAAAPPPVDEAPRTGFATGLFGLSDDVDAERVLGRMHQIALLTYIVSAEKVTANDLPIDLVQLTYQVPHPFAPGLASGEEKVAGDQLARFSAFLKRSWRVNDWTWGRLDAARVLCQMVLEPRRVRRYLNQSNETEQVLAQRVLALAAGPLGASANPTPPNGGAPPAPDPATLTALGLPDVDALATELTELGNGGEKVKKLVEVFAMALALEIAAEELPHLPRAMEQDLAAGANRRSRGAVSLAGAGDVLRAAGAPGATPEQRWAALEQFAASGMGQESLANEAASDQLLLTAATAAATAVTVLDTDRAGVGPLKPVTRVLRGGALVPYWAIKGLTSGGATGRGAAVLGLAAGGLLLAFGLLGVGPTWATTVGIGALLGTFAYGAVRSGTVLHGAVLLVPALLLLALSVPGVLAQLGAAEGTAATHAGGERDPEPGIDAVDRADRDVGSSPAVTEESADAAATTARRQSQSLVVVLATAGLVLGLFLLGSITPPVPGPVDWWDSRPLVVKFLLGVVVITLVAWAVPTPPLQRLFAQPSELDLLWLFSRDRLRPGAWPFHWAWALLGAMALLAFVVGVLAARDVRRRLMTLVLVPARNGGTGLRWEERDCRLADQTTAAWSVVYGVVAAGVAILAARLPGLVNRELVVASLGLGALLLVVVVPLRIRAHAFARVRKRAEEAFARALTTDTSEVEDPVRRLFTAGLSYRLLLRTTDADASDTASGFDQLELTRQGEQALGDAQSKSG